MASKQDLLADLLLLSHAIHRVLQDEVIEEYEDREMNACRFNLLRLLARRGPHTVNHLALFLGISKAAASQNIDVLCRRSFTIRRDDVEDRRTTWVEITKAGCSVLERAERRQRALARRIYADLPADAGQAAGNVLKELIRSVIGASRTSELTCLQCCAFRTAGCVRESRGWTCRFLETARSGKPSTAAV